MFSGLTLEWELHLQTKGTALQQDVFRSDVSNGVQLVRLTNEFAFLLCLWELCLHISLCIMCISGAFGEQTRASDSLELEL